MVVYCLSLRMPRGLGYRRSFHFRLMSSTSSTFAPIASAGEYCWLAGNPGSCLLRSSDRGRTWRLLHTDQSLPIHALQFVDKDRGWAVGAFGTILATVDGGETWTPQHSGGTRASLLGLFAEPSDVPLEVLARYCGDEGYLGVVESLTRRDVETTSAMGVDEEQRLAAGVVAASGSYANTSWRFPLRQSGTSMSADAIALGWSLTNGADGSQLLEEYLVLRIRQWRPEVVITRSSDPRRNDVLATMVSQAVLTATQKAADPAAYTNQLQVLGLKTWEVKKVCAVTDGPSSGGMGIDTSQLATRLGRSIHEHASQSYALMHKEWTPVPRKRGIELLSSTLPPAIASRDLFSGVAIANGSEARRVEGHPQATSLAELRIVTQKQRAIELLLTRASR